MSFKYPKYEIVVNKPHIIIVRDLGPHDQFPTITNAVERLIYDLRNHGYLGDSSKEKRLGYYDSSDWLDEIIYNSNGFVSFRVGATNTQDLRRSAAI